MDSKVKDQLHEDNYTETPDFSIRGLGFKNLV